ncbi:hypothetical protein B6C44_00400 [Salmonella enterica subsp. enterica serovar London]|nr:hypothetical protein [Salmonella enterica subsp. enterica serovar London]ECU9051396.1 hypothetical protein [Salmonella enterica subsp. enterica serovar London]
MFISVLCKPGIHQNIFQAAPRHKKSFGKFSNAAICCFKHRLARQTLLFQRRRVSFNRLKIHFFNVEGG